MVEMVEKVEELQKELPPFLYVKKWRQHGLFLAKNAFGGNGGNTFPLN